MKIYELFDAIVGVSWQNVDTKINEIKLIADKYPDINIHTHNFGNCETIAYHITDINVFNIFIEHKIDLNECDILKNKSYDFVKYILSLDYDFTRAKIYGNSMLYHSSLDTLNLYLNYFDKKMPRNLIAEHVNIFNLTHEPSEIYAKRYMKTLTNFFNYTQICNIINRPNTNGEYIINKTQYMHVFKLIVDNGGDICAN